MGGLTQNVNGLKHSTCKYHKLIMVLLGFVSSFFRLQNDFPFVSKNFPFHHIRFKAGHVYWSFTTMINEKNIELFSCWIISIISCTLNTFFQSVTEKITKNVLVDNFLMRKWFLFLNLLALFKHMYLLETCYECACVWEIWIRYMPKFGWVSAWWLTEGFEVIMYLICI